MRNRALAVGQGGGNIVHINAHATHAECGARAETAHGNLRVLRIIAPVFNLHTRHGGQRFG